MSDGFGGSIYQIMFWLGRMSISISTSSVKSPARWNALSASTDNPAQANRNINNPQRNIYSSSVTSKASYLEKTCFESAGAAGLELPAPMMCGYRVRVRNFLQPKLSVLFGGRRGEASVVRFSGTPQWPPRDPDRGQFLCRSRELHIVKVRF